MQQQETMVASGQTIWEESHVVGPLKVVSGALMYVRKSPDEQMAAFARFYPGEVVFPCPGYRLGETEAVYGLMAITEAKVLPYTGPLTASMCKNSSQAVADGSYNLAFLDLKQRLAEFYLTTTEKINSPTIGCIQDTVAIAVVARRETVATILAEWRENDWIQTRYRRVKVVDRDALRRIKDGHRVMAAHV